LTEAGVGGVCQHPCDVHNPCAFNAVCINTNHRTDCSCAEGYQGNGFVGCAPGRVIIIILYFILEMMFVLPLRSELIYLFLVFSSYPGFFTCKFVYFCFDLLMSVFK
jgi:hypothetical protein